jgi:D-glucuronyl C5-epimerase C-terminus
VSVPTARRTPQRNLRSMIVGSARAALGVGAEYESQPVNPAASFDATKVAGYFVDLQAKTLREPSPFVSGRGQVLGITATTRAQGALGWWDRYIAGDGAALCPFLTAAQELIREGESGAVGLLWRYDIDIAKYRRRAPWYSCMAQGQGAFVFARAPQATRDERWTQAALAAVEPLLALGSTGVLCETESGPVLEECPSEPRARSSTVGSSA